MERNRVLTPFKTVGEFPKLTLLAVLEVLLSDSESY